MDSETKFKILTPEEIHSLAIAPLPTFNIFPGKPYGKGKTWKNYDDVPVLPASLKRGEYK